MPAFEPQDPDFEARVRASFLRQQVMATLGAAMTRVAPGEVEIQLPFRPDLTQQNGFLHAGIVTTIVDSACGYAAYSLMPVGVNVLTVEYKVNLLAPALGTLFAARGRVIKPGRTITVCAGEVVATQHRVEQLVATMLATMMTVRDHSSGAE
jgi:uncharacterized protein (TIGR00369 family)